VDEHAHNGPHEPAEKGNSSQKVDPRVPFQHYVDRIRAGTLDIQSNDGRNARPPRSASLKMIIPLLLLVLGGIAYLTYSSTQSHSVGTEDDSGLYLSLNPQEKGKMERAMTSALGFVTDPNHTPAPPESTPEIATPFPFRLSASQYTAPSEYRDLSQPMGEALQFGDYVTVIPKVYGWNYTYYMVFKPDNTMRIARVYPTGETRYQAPPLKFKIKSKSSGMWQGFFIGSQEESVEKINLILSRVNGYSEDGVPGRVARFAFFLRSMDEAFYATDWAYTTLEAYAYIGKGTATSTTDGR